MHYTTAYFTSLLEKLTDIPFTLIHDDATLTHYGAIVSPPNTEPPLFIDHYVPSYINPKQPIIYITPHLERFIFISLEAHCPGKLVIGPFISSVIPKEFLHSVLNDTAVCDYPKYIDYYQQLYTLTSEKQHVLIQLIYFMLFRQTLDEIDIIIEDNWLQLPEKTMSSTLEASLKLQPTQHCIATEQQFLYLIKEGKSDDLTVLLNQGPLFFSDRVGLLSKNDTLRHYKNSSIVCIALATRAAVSGGVYTEEAYNLSDFYIQSLEDCTSTSSADVLVKKALLDFTQLVTHQQHTNLSPHVMHAKYYIKNHLYEVLKIKDVADHLNLTPNYLSACFKKETGDSLAIYIRKKRISEAKQLILQQKMSYIEIAILLKFHDHSHFSKIFKQECGISPKTYKEQHVDK